MPTFSCYSCYFYYSNHTCRAVWFLFFFPLFLFFLLSLINVTQVSSYCSVSPKESLPSVPAAQLGLISAKSELELSFLCLSSPLVLCAAPPHSLCVNQVKDNEVLCLVGQFSSISASFLSALFTHKPAFLIYLLLLAWKHILCGIWPSPWLPKSPSVQCPCHKAVFWCCLCRQTVPTHTWSALALSSSLLFPAPHICAGSVTSLKERML